MGRIMNAKTKTEAKGRFISDFFLRLNETVSPTKPSQKRNE